MAGEGGNFVLTITPRMEGSKLLSDARKNVSQLNSELSKLQPVTANTPQNQRRRAVATPDRLQERLVNGSNRSGRQIKSLTSQAENALQQQVKVVNAVTQAQRLNLKRDLTAKQRSDIRTTGRGGLEQTLGRKLTKSEISKFNAGTNSRAYSQQSALYPLKDLDKSIQRFTRDFNRQIYGSGGPLSRDKTGQRFTSQTVADTRIAPRLTPEEKSQQAGKNLTKAQKRLRKAFDDQAKVIEGYVPKLSTAEKNLIDSLKNKSKALNAQTSIISTANKSLGGAEANLRKGLNKAARAAGSVTPSQKPTDPGVAAAQKTRTELAASKAQLNSAKEIGKKTSELAKQSPVTRTVPLTAAQAPSVKEAFKSVKSASIGGTAGKPTLTYNTRDLEAIQAASRNLGPGVAAQNASKKILADTELMARLYVQMERSALGRAAVEKRSATFQTALAKDIKSGKLTSAEAATKLRAVHPTAVDSDRFRIAESEAIQRGVSPRVKRQLERSRIAREQIAAAGGSGGGRIPPTGGSYSTFGAGGNYGGGRYGGPGPGGGQPFDPYFPHRKLDQSEIFDAEDSALNAANRAQAEAATAAARALLGLQTEVAESSALQALYNESLRAEALDISAQNPLVRDARARSGATARVAKSELSNAELGFLQSDPNLSKRYFISEQERAAISELLAADAAEELLKNEGTNAQLDAIRNRRLAAENKLAAATSRVRANDPGYLDSRAQRETAKAQEELAYLRTSGGQEAQLTKDEIRTERKRIRERAAGTPDRPGLFGRATHALGYDRAGSTSPTQFFGGGALATLRYGLPSLALYGAASGLGNMLTEAEELQYSLKRLEGQYGSLYGSLDGFDQVRGKILGVAEATGLQADQIADLRVQLTGAFGQNIEADGLSGEGLVDKQTEDAAKIAQTVKLPLQEVTDGLTAASLAFGGDKGSAATFQKIGDVALRLEEKSGVLAKETVSFIGDIAPVAEEAGYSVEEFAAIAAVAQQRSGRSGTALAESFGRVIPALTENKDKLLELAAADSALGTPEFIDAIRGSDTKAIFNGIGAAYNNMTKENKQLVIQLLGGRREAQAIIPAITNQSLVKDYEAAANDSEGTLEERFADIQETLTNIKQRLGEAFKQFGVLVFDSGIIEAMENMASGASVFLKLLTKVASVAATLNNLFGGMPAQILLLAAAWKLVNKYVVKKPITKTDEYGEKIVQKDAAGNVLRENRTTAFRRNFDKAGGTRGAARTFFNDTRFGSAYNEARTAPPPKVTYTPPSTATGKSLVPFSKSVVPYTPPPVPSAVSKFKNPFKGFGAGASAAIFSSTGFFVGLTAVTATYAKISGQIQKDKDALAKIDEDIVAANSELDLSLSNVRENRIIDLEAEARDAQSKLDSDAWSRVFNSIFNIQSDADRFLAAATALKAPPEFREISENILTNKSLTTDISKVTRPELGKPTSDLRELLGLGSFGKPAEFEQFRETSDGLLEVVGSMWTQELGESESDYVRKIAKDANISATNPDDAKELQFLVDTFSAAGTDPVKTLLETALNIPGSDASPGEIEVARATLETIYAQLKKENPDLYAQLKIQEEKLPVEDNTADYELINKSFELGAITRQEFADRIGKNAEELNKILGKGDVAPGEEEILNALEKKKASQEALDKDLQKSFDRDKTIAEAFGATESDIRDQDLVRLNAAVDPETGFQSSEARLDAALRLVEVTGAQRLIIAQQAHDTEEVAKILSEGFDIPTEARIAITIANAELDGGFKTVQLNYLKLRSVIEEANESQRETLRGFRLETAVWGHGAILGLGPVETPDLSVRRAGPSTAAAAENAARAAAVERAAESYSRDAKASSGIGYVGTVDSAEAAKLSEASAAKALLETASAEVDRAEADLAFSKSAYEHNSDPGWIPVLRARKILDQKRLAYAKRQEEQAQRAVDAISTPRSAPRVQASADALEKTDAALKINLARATDAVNQASSELATAKTNEDSYTGTDPDMIAVLKARRLLAERRLAYFEAEAAKAAATSAAGAGANGAKAAEAAASAAAAAAVVESERAAAGAGPASAAAAGSTAAARVISSAAAKNAENQIKASAYYGVNYKDEVEKNLLKRLANVPAPLREENLEAAYKKYLTEAYTPEGLTDQSTEELKRSLTYLSDLRSQEGLTDEQKDQIDSVAGFYAGLLSDAGTTQAELDKLFKGKRGGKQSKAFTSGFESVPDQVASNARVTSAAYDNLRKLQDAQLAYFEAQHPGDLITVAAERARLSAARAKNFRNLGDLESAEAQQAFADELNDAKATKDAIVDKFVSGLELFAGRLDISGDTQGADQVRIQIAKKRLENAPVDSAEHDSAELALAQQEDQARKNAEAIQLGGYDYLSAALEADGKLLDAATVRLKKANLAASFARSPLDKQAAAQEVLAAEENVKQVKAEQRDAQFALFSTIIAKDDPVAQAKIDLVLAQAQLDEAKGIKAQAEAQKRLIEVQRQLTDAMSEVRYSQYSLRQAELQAMEDDIGAARVGAELARAQLNDAIKAGAGAAEINNLRAAVVTSDKAAKDAIFQDRLDEYQYLFDMEKITRGQYVNYLESLKSTLIPGSKKFKDLELQIKRLKDDISGDLQANLPTALTLPTLYEVRRFDQSNTSAIPGQAGNSVGYQDNRQMDIQITIGQNMSESQIVDVLSQALGTGTSGYGPRRY